MPRTGWMRALGYMGHRLRRLPDRPSKVALGLAVGVFVCFTPLFGFHIAAAAALAWLIGGNVLAAMIGTFFGNPATFPLIATISLWFGRKVLGIGHSSETMNDFELVAFAFAKAFLGVWQTMKSLVTDVPAAWGMLGTFFQELFLPYMVGGLIPGLIAGAITFFVSRPLVAAYQKRRRDKLRARVAKREARARLAAEKAALKAGNAKHSPPKG
nr:DUF2062 domain-containing protein [Rubricella aquisinus]